MRCLEVILNGQLLWRAGTENALMYSLDLGVSLDGESPAYISVSGMCELPGGRKAHVRWGELYPLSIGDHLALTLVESEQPTPPAETNAADEPEQAQEPDEDEESAMSGEDEQDPTTSLWNRIQVRCAINGETKAEAEISSREAYLMGSLRWNQWHPDRCRVAVHSCLQAGAPDRNWLNADLGINDCMEFQIQSR